MAPQITQVQRLTIIALRQSGHTVSQIGQRMGISVSFFGYLIIYFLILIIIFYSICVE